MVKQTHTEDYLEYDVVKVQGIDMEPEDREVGIFGNYFVLGIKDKKGKEIQLGFCDDEFVQLLEAIKPYIKNYEQEEQYGI